MKMNRLLNLFDKQFDEIDVGIPKHDFRINIKVKNFGRNYYFYITLSKGDKMIDPTILDSDTLKFISEFYRTTFNSILSQCTREGRFNNFKHILNLLKKEGRIYLNTIFASVTNFNIYTIDQYHRSIFAQTYTEFEGNVVSIISKDYLTRKKQIPWTAFHITNTGLVSGLLRNEFSKLYSYIKNIILLVRSILITFGSLAELFVLFVSSSEMQSIGTDENKILIYVMISILVAVITFVSYMKTPKVIFRNMAKIPKHGETDNN